MAVGSSLRISVAWAAVKVDDHDAVWTPGLSHLKISAINGGFRTVATRGIRLCGADRSIEQVICPGHILFQHGLGGVAFVAIAGGVAGVVACQPVADPDAIRGADQMWLWRRGMIGLL